MRGEEYRERYTPEWHRRIIGNASATKGDEIALVPGGIVENYGRCFAMERDGVRDDRPLRSVGLTLAIEHLAKAVEELLHALRIGISPARVTACFEIDIRHHMVVISRRPLGAITDSATRAARVLDELKSVATSTRSNSSSWWGGTRASTGASTAFATLMMASASLSRLDSSA